MDFDRILEKTLSFEGGYSNDKFDRGGATKFGITIGTLKSYRIDTNGDGVVNIKDVEDLSLDEASNIYRKYYYSSPRINLLPEDIQSVLFDMAVNHGPSRAVKILQSVINQVGIYNTSEDGIIGPHTAQCADGTYRRMGIYLINALCDERQIFYDGIVLRRPDQKRFIKGWTRRADAFRIERKV